MRNTITVKFDGLDVIDENALYPIIHKIAGDQITLAKREKAYSATRIYSYPFLRDEMCVQDLLEIFGSIYDEKVLLTHNPQDPSEFANGTKVVSDGLFRGQPVVWHWIVDYGYRFVKLIDYFQERCRIVGCRRNNQTLTGFEFFNKKIKIINKLCERPITYNGIFKAFMTLKYSLCSEFNPIIAFTLYNYFKQLLKPSEGRDRLRTLDMSAGRGSRMLGAMAVGIDYVGVDPDSCVNENFETMRQFYSAAIHKRNGTPPSSTVTFHQAKFEDVKLDGLFDFMFSSPPYFDLEIFSKELTQSVHTHNSLENWLQNFMYVSMKKILDHLVIGGIMAINIDNPRNQKVDYVNPMLAFKFDNAKYIGVLQVLTSNNVYYNIWCWERV